jgi:hypothetical protein
LPNAKAMLPVPMMLIRGFRSIFVDRLD